MSLLPKGSTVQYTLYFIEVERVIKGEDKMKKMKHKDCEYFSNGKCSLRNMEVPAEGEACDSFGPKA